MRIDSRSDGSLHVRDTFGFVRIGLLAAAAVFGALGIALGGSDGDARSAWGAVIGLVGCALFAAVVEDSDFDFDAAARELRWKRRRLFGAVGGTIPFSAIDDVEIEQKGERSDSGLSLSLDYRVFVVTDGERLALGMRNLDRRTARERIAVPLLALLGREDGEIIESGIATGARLTH